MSRQQRVWSTLLNYRDWASYVYVPLLVSLLFLLPSFVVKSYQRSRRINPLIQSLSQGSRDLDQMTQLLQSRSVPWNGVPFEEIDKDFLTYARPERRTPEFARRDLGHSDPARAILIFLALAVPEELDLYAAIFVRVDLLALGTNDHGRL